MARTFGDVLKEARTARGISQERLALLTGKDRGHLSKIETGRIGMPTVEVIDELAAALGMERDELLAPLGLTRVESAGPWFAIDLDSDELLQLYGRLSDDDRVRLVAIARALWQVSAGKT